MQKSLLKYLKEDGADPDFSLHYQIGDQFSGETSFELCGNGTYQLSSNVTSNRQPCSYSGKLEPTRVRQVVEQLVSAKVWEAESKKQPGPGETRATITVRQGSESEQVALWTREIGDNLPFAFSQEAFLTLVQEVSNGVVLESGS